MKVLVFGGGGMAGHVVTEYLRETALHEVWSTVRGPASRGRCLAVDVLDERQLDEAIRSVRPDVVVNAIGVLNHRAAQDTERAIFINSLLPHRLARKARDGSFRLIHLSTDCVFSGRKGNYREDDTPDGSTVYARTKILGEVNVPPHLTLRTSMIGPELKGDGIGLFHWFMQQTGHIRGYRQVFWNGVTTLELAKVLADCLTTNTSGVVHLVAPEKVSKFVLLQLLQNAFNKRDVEIQPDDAIQCDKSLVNTRADFSPAIRPYGAMFEDLRIWMESHHQGRYLYA